MKISKKDKKMAIKELYKIAKKTRILNKRMKAIKGILILMGLWNLKKE